MTGVRLFHIKSFLGDNVYITRGVNTPHPRAGDLEILLSYLRRNTSCYHLGGCHQEIRGTVFAITTSQTQLSPKKQTSKSFCPKKLSRINSKTLLHPSSIRVKPIASETGGTSWRKRTQLARVHNQLVSLSNPIKGAIFTLFSASSQSLHPSIPLLRIEESVVQVLF